MYYEVINSSLIDPKYPFCQEKYIWIHQKPGEKFKGLNCYGRPPISYETSQNNKHFKKISIINGLNGVLIVLKCLKINVDSLEWYNYNEWYQFSDIFNEILNIAILRTATLEKYRST